MLKGSYYVNCAFYQGKDITVPQSIDFPEFTTPNVWPPEKYLPKFRETFEELCCLIIDAAVLVARACDRYALAHVEDYPYGYLEHVVKSSMTTKARLLHYFPPKAAPPDSQDLSIQKSQPPNRSSDYDSWCATHIDHGCLTGLTSAIYVNEGTHPPQFSSTDSTIPTLPSLQAPPDPSIGLYVHARDSTITKVSIPSDCLGFQTGEALQLMTRGKFRAVPHFVRAGGDAVEGKEVARNTLAVFTQPNLNEIVDCEKGRTFGDLSREVVERFG